MLDLDRWPGFRKRQVWGIGSILGVTVAMLGAIPYSTSAQEVEQRTVGLLGMGSVHAVQPALDQR
jgi:hypothetical protein